MLTVVIPRETFSSLISEAEEGEWMPTMATSVITAVGMIKLTR